MRMQKETDEVKLADMSAFQLIDLLDRAYPPRCIAANEKPHEAHRYAGLRELVESLVAEKQHELDTAD